MALSTLSEKGASVVDKLFLLAQEKGALDLAREYPDFPPPPELTGRAVHHLQNEGKRYSPPEGIVRLREILSSLFWKNYSCTFNPQTEITITSGATQGIYTAISTFLTEGDEAIVFEPAYDIYVPSILSVGGRPKYLTLKKPDFRIDWEEVQKVISSSTRIIIINSPHNPTGSILSAFDMEKLQKIIQGTKITVISDEVFEHIIYEGFEHQSVARFPALAEKSLILSSFGKSHQISGWKLGYCAGPAHLMEKFRRMQQFQVNSANIPLQYAISDYLESNPDFKKIASYYEELRNLMIQKIRHSGFRVYAPSGTYFLLLDHENISGQKDIDYAEFLVREKGILVLPVSVFNHDLYNQHLLRLCFARPPAILEEAAKRLLA